MVLNDAVRQVPTLMACVPCFSSCDRIELIQSGHLFDIGRIRPVVETVFPLSEARQAFERGLGGHTRGKIILQEAG